MIYDESSIKNENLTSDNLEKLDRVLSQVVNALEKGRNEIFEIAEDCHKQCADMEVELEELKIETKQVIEEVEEHEKLLYKARIRLMEVSRNFRSYSEDDIKEAYEKAREIQVALNDLKQKELYLRRRRDELAVQIKRMKQIAGKAYKVLDDTGMALKILRGNVEKISSTFEEARRKRQMEMWIIESQEAERRKIARELHDGPAQSMASMLIRLDLIGYLGIKEPDRIKEEIESIKAMGKETLGDIRRIMFDLKPTILGEDNLSSALKEYFDDYKAKYNFNIDFIFFGKKRKYNLSLEIALFRLVQEAINNVRKHAGVKSAVVKMEDNDRYLTLIIKDEGEGFDVEQVSANKESFGIIGMKERVELFGGELRIFSSPGSGTQVLIRVPLEGEDDGEQNKGSDS